jgi:hypothetical protein
MKKLFFLASILIMHFSINAQHTLKGFITNKKGESIGNTHIQLGNKGTSSNEKGYFIFTTEKSTFSLQFSHISHQTLKQKINLNSADTFIVFQLEEKNKQLQEVIITDKQKDYSNVLAFEISNNIQYILYEKHFKRFIKVKHLSEDWEVSNKVSNSIKQLQKDCFGNIYITDKRNAFQLAIEDKKMLAIDKTSIEKFEQIISPCVESIDGKIVMTKYKNHDQMIDYFLLEEGKEKKINTVYHKEQAEVAASYYAEIIQEYYKATASFGNKIKLGVWDGNLISLAENAKLVRLIGWYLHFAAKPLYSPIFNINKHLYLFDFTNAQLLQYDANGELIKTSPLAFHKEKDWDKLLILDEQTNEIYAQFMRSGVITLKKINLTNGEIKNSQRISATIFPENLRLNNGKIYYIKKEDNVLGKINEIALNK